MSSGLLRPLALAPPFVATGNQVSTPKHLFKPETANGNRVNHYLGHFANRDRELAQKWEAWNGEIGCNGGQWTSELNVLGMFREKLSSRSANIR